MHVTRPTIVSVVVALVFGLLVAPTPAFAHCDTMDGPVVKAGQKALDTGELDYALIWVQPAAEPELRAAFAKALEVRKLGGAARELADTYFFETLVRLHRAGEGEPYTGIEPKGTDLGLAIPAADAAIDSGSTRAVSKLITDAAAKGLASRFAGVSTARKFRVHDVAAGRRYVAAYVLFVHYVERLYDDARGLAPALHDAGAEEHRHESARSDEPARDHL